MVCRRHCLFIGKLTISLLRSGRPHREAWGRDLPDAGGLGFVAPNGGLRAENPSLNGQNPSAA